MIFLDKPKLVQLDLIPDKVPLKFPQQELKKSKKKRRWNK